MHMKFKDKCYELLKRIPKGKVVTYKEIARALNTNACRQAGRAMKENNNKNISCYKVIKSNGEIGGFNRGKKEKIKLLKKDGIIIKKGKVDLRKYGYRFRTPFSPSMQ